MTKEFRRIIFSSKTLREAVDNHLATLDKDIPKGDIASVKSGRQEADFIFELELFDYSRKKGKSAWVLEGDMLEAMIQYCLANKIVLPRKARKTARLIEGHICMDIFMDVDEDSNFAA